VDEFTANLMAGVSAVRQHSMRTPWGETGEPFWAARLPESFEAADVPESLAPFMDRNTHFALDAARQALNQSGLLERANTRLGRGVVIIGTGMAGQNTISEVFAATFIERKSRVHPFTVPRIMPSAPNSLICMRYGLHAPGFSVSSACASSNHAIGIALMMLRSGQADWAITGGTEAGITHMGLASWKSMRVVSKSFSAPFSEGPPGMAIGEGAGIVVLETQQHLEASGGKPLCEVAGFGMTSDGAHITQMNPEVAAIAVRAALDDAGITPAEVGHINAHGTGTELNDRCEAEVIHRVYGEYATRIPVCSTKAAHGHAIGATSALELIAGMASLQQQKVPPTANFTKLRSGAELNVVHGAALEAPIDTVVSHAFGFGGLNAIVVLRR
jgi:nodulation protein E